MHPLILYNVNDDEERVKAEEAGAAILEMCVELGGCLTGEHGVGIEKRELMGASSTTSNSRSRSVCAPHSTPKGGSIRPRCFRSASGRHDRSAQARARGRRGRSGSSGAARRDEARHRRRRRDGGPRAAARGKAPAVERGNVGNYFLCAGRNDALREGRHDSRGDRGGDRRARPDAAVRADAPASALGLRRRADARRHGRDQPRGPSPAERRSGARRRPRPQARQRPGPNDPLRRAGDEERHRPRSNQAQLRRARHARRSDRSDNQACAQAGGRNHAGHAGPWRVQRRSKP